MFPDNAIVEQISGPKEGIGRKGRVIRSDERSWPWVKWEGGEASWASPHVLRLVSPTPERLYTVVRTATGDGLDFSLSPMSGKPAFSWVPYKRATRFTRAQAHAACCLLTMIAPADALSVEEAE